jgi:hypothetical protein
MAANESSKYTHFSNLSVGTSSGGGDILAGGISLSPTVTTVTGATTLTAAQCGVVILDAAAGATVTLPALADGLYYKIIVGATFGTSNWVIDSAEGDNINGVITVNNTTILAGAEDQINFVNSAENIGDYIEIIADSGNSQWIVTGTAHAAGAITATDPS